MSRHEIVIVGGARTPMAEYVGAFKDVSAIELGARATIAALERAGAQPGWVDHVVMGNALQTSREDMDAYALRSQKAAAAARARGVFKDEIVPVDAPSGRKTVRVEEDDHLRPDTTLEGLAALKPSFGKDGFVTAGNASGIVDGAAALVVAHEDEARRRSLKPLARVVSWAVAGVPPEIMGIGPVPASRKALEAASLSIKDMDLVEVNEAFAGHDLAGGKGLGPDRK